MRLGSVDFAKVSGDLSSRNFAISAFGVHDALQRSPRAQIELSLQISGRLPIKRSTKSVVEGLVIAWVAKCIHIQVPIKRSNLVLLSFLAGGSLSWGLKHFLSEGRNQTLQLLDVVSLDESGSPEFLKGSRLVIGEEI